MMDDQEDKKGQKQSSLLIALQTVLYKFRSEIAYSRAHEDEALIRQIASEALTVAEHLEKTENED